MAKRPSKPGYFWLAGPGREPQPVEVGWENERGPDKGPLVIRQLGSAEQTPLEQLDPADRLLPLFYGI